MPEVFASLGSNQQREYNIRSAVRALRQRFGELRISPVYDSRAVGFEGSDFLNLVVGFDSEETAETIHAVFHDIEAEHGRTRETERFAPRTLDIDLLLYGNEVIQAPDFSVPREEILEYAFVLQPLADLIPQYRHPLTGQTYAAMWRDYQGSRALRAVPFTFD